MKFLKSFISIICAFALMVCMPVFSSAEDKQDINYKQYNCNIDDIKYVNNIRDQGSRNMCTYYALIAAAESFAIKYFNSENIEFSIDKLFSAIGSEDEYDVIIKNCTDEPLTDDDSYYFISTANQFNGYTGSIKKAVYESGAAVVTFGVQEISALNNEKYYSPKNASFFGNGDGYHHAVSIVGWDDGYSRNNFSEKPNMDGAWICQNSYGEDYGKGGFFYLSYAQTIESAASLTLSFFDSIKYEYNEVNQNKFERVNIYSITSLNVYKDSQNNKSAYAKSENGDSFKCTFIKDYTSGMYFVRLPESDDCLYYFDENTVVIFNGDIIGMGITDGNQPEYEISPNGAINIAVKDKSGYEIVAVKVPKYDLGYIRLIYDDGSERMIFKSNAKSKGISISDYKKSEIDYSGEKSLPDITSKEYYSVIVFDDSFVFSDSCKYYSDGKTIKDEDYIFENNQLILATKSLIAEISLQGAIFEFLLKPFAVLFGSLGFIINFIN